MNIQGGQGDPKNTSSCVWRPAVQFSARMLTGRQMANLIGRLLRGLQLVSQLGFAYATSTCFQWPLGQSSLRLITWSHPFFGIPKRWIGSGTFSSGCKFVTGKYGPFFFDPEGASTVILLYQSQFLSSNDRQKAMEDQMDGSPSCTGH